MSYDIVYDRQFIRSPAGITPLVLVGCNNVTETTWRGRERRVRDWHPLFGESALSEAELLKRTEACCSGTYQEHFKRSGKWVDDAGFLRFVQNGIKNARTLEEIQALKPGVCLHCSLSIWRREDSDERRYGELARTVRTTEELTGWIASARERAAAKAENERIFFVLRFPNEEPLHLPPVVHLSGPVAARKGRGYIAVVAPTSISIAFSCENALIFESAQSALERIPAYFHGDIRLCSAESILQKRRCRHIIQVSSGGYAGNYVEQLTRSRLHMTALTERARRFPSEKSARQYIETKLRPRLKGMEFTVQTLPTEQEVPVQ